MTSVPDGFLLGTATSSYQIEGGVAEDGRGPSIWDTFSHEDGRVRGGDTGDVACDHYHRLEDDLDLLAWLGVDAYRFSVAWPRVQPDGRRVEPRGLGFYDRLVDGLLERGVEPFVTLYHWDLPQALEDAGGWSDRDTAGRFTDYAAVVADALGDRVRWWATLNEPWCSAFLGYASGVHAPGVRDDARAVAAVHHLLLAHGRAVPALRSVGADARVGIVLNPAPIRPLEDTEADRAAARLADGLRNRVWLDPLVHGRYPDDVLSAWAGNPGLGAVQEGDLVEISAPLDLVGVNYYHPVVVTTSADGAEPVGVGLSGMRDRHVEGIRTTMGWGVDPSGLTELLLRLAADYPDLPLMVTENGAAFPDETDEHGHVEDEDRVGFLRDHLRATLDARERGADVRGYFVWSMLDNFEWAEGYAQRFGIVRVDPEDLRRIPKRSAEWLRGVASARRIPD
jgi:beta-glucosidase